MGDSAFRVLVIDDDEEIRDAIGFYLDQNNIEYKMIDDGYEGLQKIRNEDYDLILLDITMPTFTGLDIINSLKKEGIFESKRIVVITASSDGLMMEEIRNGGIKDILKKPCSMDELEELIEKWK